MNSFSKLALVALASLPLGACMTSDMAMDDGMTSSTSVSTVGGAEMFANRNIIQNAVNSPIHTNLVAAVKAADLVDTLSGAGPFTVFAPTDEAFARLPAGTVDTLLMPANKAMLTNVLTYHVVPGRITAADIAARIRAGGGRATFATVNGGTLTATMANGSVMLTGANGSSYVTQADVMQSNGVIHVVNGVLVP